MSLTVAAKLEDATSQGKLYHGHVHYFSSVSIERLSFTISAWCWTKGYDPLNSPLCTADDPNSLNTTLPKCSVYPILTSWHKAQTSTLLASPARPVQRLSPFHKRRSVA